MKLNGIPVPEFDDEVKEFTAQAFPSYQNKMRELEEKICVMIEEGCLPDDMNSELDEIATSLNVVQKSESFMIQLFAYGMYMVQKYNHIGTSDGCDMYGMLAMAASIYADYNIEDVSETYLNCAAMVTDSYLTMLNGKAAEMLYNMIEKRKDDGKDE